MSTLATFSTWGQNLRDVAIIYKPLRPHSEARNKLLPGIQSQATLPGSTRRVRGEYAESWLMLLGIWGVRGGRNKPTGDYTPRIRFLQPLALSTRPCRLFTACECKWRSEPLLCYSLTLSWLDCMSQMEVGTFYLWFPLAHLIRLHVAKLKSKPCICYSLSLNWLDYMLQMDVQTLYLSLPFAQLIRLHVANVDPNFVFVTPSRSSGYITCCKLEVQIHNLLLPLTQLIRLRVANGGWHLVFATPSHSIDQITFCECRSKSFMCYTLSLNWLDYMCTWKYKPCMSSSLSCNWLHYMLQMEVQILYVYSLSLNLLDCMLQMEAQTLHVLLPLAQLIRLHVVNECPNLVFVTPSRSID